LSYIEARNDFALVVGNLNRAVGNDQLWVPGSKAKVSYGGTLIRNLLSRGKYMMVNSLRLTMGGPWTRICPVTGDPSCLNLALASAGLVPYIMEMLVDRTREFTPRRAITKKNKVGTNFTDHYPLIIKIELPKAEENEQTKNNIEH
jgi:hypothetical protein